MAELQESSKIQNLALTNFDPEHLQIIVDNDIKIVSNQVQFSLVDCRLEVQTSQFCQKHDIKLFAYGTLCGGFVGEIPWTARTARMGEHCYLEKIQEDDRYLGRMESVSRAAFQSETHWPEVKRKRF